MAARHRVLSQKMGVPGNEGWTVQSTLSRIGVVVFLLAMGGFVWFLSRGDTPAPAPARSTVTPKQPEAVRDTTQASLAPPPPSTPPREQAPADPHGISGRVTVRLPDGCRVEGMVKDAEGAPIAAASVYVGDITTTKPDAITDERGVFTITTLAQTDSLLTASHPDHLPGSVAVTPHLGAVAHVEIVLETGGTIEGAVTRGSQPVPGHPVFMRSQDGASPETRTDQEGRYRFAPVPLGETLVFVGAVANDTQPGRVVRKTVTVENGKTALVDFDLLSGGATVEGAVTINGQPPESGSIFAEVMGQQSDDVVSVELASDGMYRFEDVSPGIVRLHADVSTGDLKRRKVVEITVREGETVRQDIQFAEALAITGTLTGLRESESATVFVMTGGSPNVNSVQDLMLLHSQVAAEQAVDADGEFRMEGLEPGSYFVTAVAIDSEVQADGAFVPHIRSASHAVTLTPRAQPHVQLVLR